MVKDLVVILDEEGQNTARSLGYPYFGKSRGGKSSTYKIETPLGRQRTVKGVLVKDAPLDEHTAEFLYLEDTDRCNFSCLGCGVGNNLTHVGLTHLLEDKSRYLTPNFVTQLAGRIGNSPYANTTTRRIFHGGGEPLINPTALARVLRGLATVDNTTQLVLTNGCNLPLDKEEFTAFMARLGNPYIVLTYTNSHEKFYEQLAKTGLYRQLIPSKVQAHDSLKEKIKIIGGYCKHLNVDFAGHVVADAFPSP
ncbi:MAG TPA: radical SAM protein, partial [Candidatus Nanoarchaeia archaeon]|nr:radical SAM protein [Candidatus Nanoarchaeia archaeon]